MKNKLKLTLAALSLAATLLCATSAVAVDTTVYGAGSSAIFNEMGLAAGLNNAWPGNGALCGDRHWSNKNAAKLHDSRDPSILDETGNMWIVWNAAAETNSPGSRICYFVTLDSIVGNREFFAYAHTLMILPSGSADGNIIPLLGPGVALNATVWNSVNNSLLNTAFSDIRPEDAKFATLRALTTLGTQVIGKAETGLGYGPFFIGTPIKSAFSAAQANVVDFVIDNGGGEVDPLGGAPARIHTTISIGAQPLMVIANVSNTAQGHLGSGLPANWLYQNVNRWTLNGVFTGALCHVHDLATNPSEAAVDVPLNTILREPLSGTYNTFEFDVTHTREVYVFTPGSVSGQETGVTTNPLNQTCAPVNAAKRQRGVGTGEVIKNVNLNADTMGYAFWSFGNFSAAPNVRYMTVDGVDPLYSGPASNPTGPGTFPLCSPSCPFLTFPNIVNGAYPLWSNVRVIYDPTDSSNIAPALVLYSQHAANATITDYIPAYGVAGISPTVGVFRSHYNQVIQGSGEPFPGHDLGGNNGFIPAGIPETGGDMGGAILTIQSELDAGNDAGLRGITQFQAEQTGLLQ